MRPSCLALALVLLAACHRGEHAPDAHTRTDHAPPTPAEPSNVTVSVDGGRASAVANAIGAITAAQGQGGTPCEQAYNGMVAMFRGLALPDGGRREAPDRARFLSACTQLPAEVQHCMVFTYAIAHQAECRTMRGRMTPEDTARMHAVMTGH